MSKQNILRITLFVSVLVFNPAVAQTRNQLSNIQTQQSSSVTASIANILHKRGLDEDAAHEISAQMVEDEDEMLLAMIENIVQHCEGLTQNDVLEYMSTEALHRKEVKLNSYAQLTHMFSKIKQRSPDKETRKQLSRVAKFNSRSVV